MSKKPEAVVKVALPLKIWERMKAAGKEDQRTGRYMVIRACLRDLEKNTDD